MTDTNDTTDDRETVRKPTRDDGEPMKMKEMDHAPPVEGTRRVFERANEGKTARPDGGQQTSDRETDADDEFSQTMKEIDHTPPVDGPNRTFERGAETDVDK
ncbi:hypothetical protein SAMN05216226_10596 [Halovenus aranensis]|uniref:Uncharacterized protein n=1 Tax=Halovenus aranensis TaxID=890420 RepID=A0A1G8USP1_9EURY|nr:hypothetical protein [Halovenus aranensis]SDJ56803.1 hypothetical protein SAMN05216226_10596 [Halovenus aranensis]